MGLDKPYWGFVLTEERPPSDEGNLAVGTRPCAQATNTLRVARNVSERVRLDANHDNLISDENGNGRKRNPGRLRITAKEVAGDGCPAGADCDQGAADIVRRHRDREDCSIHVSEPVKLTQRSNDDKKFNSDSYSRPMFFRHAQACSLGAAVKVKL